MVGMTEQPLNGPAMRGAVDLSSLSRPAGGAAGAPGGAPGEGGSDALVVEGTDSTFNAVVDASVTVPSVVVLWADQFPGSRDYVDLMTRVARSYQGRFQVVSVDVAANSGVLQAFTPVLQQAFQDVQSLPIVVGLLQGQPLPLFAGAQSEDQTRAVIDKLLEAAVANGVTGRVPVGEETEEPEDAEDGGSEEQAEAEPLPPLHQEAFDAIERGDFEAATDAYTRALTDNPADEDAKLGLAQVGLMQRTSGLDPQQVREAAAQSPTDVQTQLNAADLDVLGGHVEDGFARLIDLVKVTAGEERNAVRQHLLQLFDVVGTHDERVRTARNSLMSALF